MISTNCSLPIVRGRKRKEDDRLRDERGGFQSTWRSADGPTGHRDEVTLCSKRSGCSRLKLATHGDA